MFGNHSIVRSTAVVAALATVALGQQKNVEPYRVVTTEKVALRCGDGEFMYKVGEVPAGTVLTVDGESGESGKPAGWLRVSYPAGFSAFVKADDVDVQGAEAKLTKKSRLVAVNAAAGFKGSWKMLLATELPEGTKLKVMEPIKDESGPIAGYRIVPPDGARAFVEARATRKAEGEAAKVPPTSPAAAAPTKTPPADSKPTDAKPAETKANEVKPGETKPGEAKPASGTSTPPAGTAQTPAAEPVKLAEPMVKPADNAAPPVTINQAPAAAPVVPPTDFAARPVGDWSVLDRTFRNVWKQPVLEAELDELLAEHQRALDAIPADQERLHTQIERRIDAIRLRMEVRSKLREQALARAAVESQNGKVDEQLALAEKGRVYTIIGQLQPSTVYDGEKLPLMYRVVSVGGAAPKTLGYLKDDVKFNFKGRIGAVLGVIGDAQLDRSLMLNVITPVRVDVLRPGSEAGGAPSSAAAPKTGG